MEPPRCKVCGWPLLDGWFDDARHQIVIGNERRHVPGTAWLLLTFLRLHPGQLLPSERLYNLLYADRLDPPSIKTLYVHLGRLRRRLKGTPFRITGLRKDGGYMLDRIAAQV